MCEQRLGVYSRALRAASTKHAGQQRKACLWPAAGRVRTRRNDKATGAGWLLASANHRARYLQRRCLTPPRPPAMPRQYRFLRAASRARFAAVSISHAFMIPRSCPTQRPTLRCRMCLIEMDIDKSRFMRITYIKTARIDACSRRRRRWPRTQPRYRHGAAGGPSGRRCASASD